MLNVIKSGVNPNGKIWVYGTLSTNGIELINIFNTNLEKPVPAGESFTIKKLKITSRNNVIKFSIEV